MAVNEENIAMSEFNDNFDEGENSNYDCSFCSFLDSSDSEESSLLSVDSFYDEIEEKRNELSKSINKRIRNLNKVKIAFQKKYFKSQTFKSLITFNSLIGLFSFRGEGYPYNKSAEDTYQLYLLRQEIEDNKFYVSLNNIRNLSYDDSVLFTIRRKNIAFRIQRIISHNVSVDLQFHHKFINNIGSNCITNKSHTGLDLQENAWAGGFFNLSHKPKEHELSPFLNDFTKLIYYQQRHYTSNDNDLIIAFKSFDSYEWKSLYEFNKNYLQLLLLTKFGYSNSNSYIKTIEVKNKAFRVYRDNKSVENKIISNKYKKKHKNRNNNNKIIYNNKEVKVKIVDEDRSNCITNKSHTGLDLQENAWAGGFSNLSHKPKEHEQSLSSENNYSAQDSATGDDFKIKCNQN